MSWVVRALVLSLLALTAWKVHEARALRARTLAGDPERVAAMQARLDALPQTGLEDEWVGRAFPFEDGAGPTGGADCYARVRYRDPDENEVILYVAGAAHFREWFHTPNFCLIAQGWEMRDRGEGRYFDLAGLDADATMERVVTEHGHRQMISYFWLMEGGVLRAPKWGQRLQRALDLLAGRGPSSTWLVVLYVPVRTDLDAAERVAGSFVRAMMPHLRAATADAEQE